MTTTLVLGAERSGKSRYAQSLLAAHQQVTFVATGPRPGPGDPDLTHRLKQHQDPRPQGWTTVETHDLTRAMLNSRHPVLIDDIGSWVYGVIDDAGAWGKPAVVDQELGARVDELVVAWRHLPFDVVAVSPETGWGVPSRSPEERLLRDALGYVNGRLSRSSHQVHLVVASRVIDLSNAPLVPAAH